MRPLILVLYSGGSENRYSADNPKARIKGALGDLLAVLTTNLQIESNIDPLIAFAQDLVHRSDHHLSRNRINRRLPDRHLQSRLSNEFNPLTSLKDYATAMFRWTRAKILAR